MLILFRCDLILQRRIHFSTISYPFMHVHWRMVALSYPNATDETTQGLHLLAGPQSRTKKILKCKNIVSFLIFITSFRNNFISSRKWIWNYIGEDGMKVECKISHFKIVVQRWLSIIKIKLTKMMDFKWWSIGMFRRNNANSFASINIFL